MRRTLKYLCVFCLYRSWDYPENFGIYSQLQRKSKTCFFYYPHCVCILNRRDKVLASQFLPPKFRYFATQTGPKWEDSMKMNFENWNAKMSFLNRYDSKSRWKNGVIFLVFMSHPWVKKISKTAIEIYVYAFESSRFAL